MLKMLDLFSGIGGFSLAADWTGGIETVAFCEIEPFCQRVLKKHWPDVPCYSDIKELNGVELVREHGTVDIVCGGFPCQPFSVAGKQLGKSDDRYLWKEMFRIIQETKPTWIVSENVTGLIELALEDCFLDLETEGYEVQPLIIPACAVNAPHQRNRVWILAHSRNNTGRNSERGSIGRNGSGSMEKAEWATEAVEITRPSEASGVVADTDSEGLQGNKKPRSDGKEWEKPIDKQSMRCNRANESWWTTEPDVGRSHDGLSAELDGGRLNATQTGTGETLSDLRKEIGEETLQRSAGGLGIVSQKEILQSIVRQHQTGTNQGRIEMESRTTPRECLQCLRFNGESPCSPYQRRYNGQQAGEHSDFMRFLPCQTPSFYPETWADGSWEDGLPRVATGIPNRVHRLKCLGNSIVPQVAYQILQGIVEIEGGQP